MKRTLLLVVLFGVIAGCGKTTSPEGQAKQERIKIAAKMLENKQAAEEKTTGFAELRSRTESECE